MKVVGVVGPSDSGKTTLVESLVERLKTDGSVATVKHLTHSPDVDTEGKDTDRHRRAGASATYGMTDHGSWFATGSSRSLSDLLDDLAPYYEYVLLEGFSDVDVPQIVLGERDHAGEALVTASDASAVDVDAVVEDLGDVDPHVTLESLVSRAKESPEAEKAGAIATFTGRVRAKDSDDDTPTEYLEFEKYEGVAADRMATIRRELGARDGVYEVLMHHRTGIVEYGEDIVFVVVLAGHREEAFSTVEDGINRLKDEVPIFKKEVTHDEEFWVHSRS